MPFKNPARFDQESGVKSFPVHAFLPGDTAATAANYGRFFTAPAKCVVDSVNAIWRTASTSGTLNIEKIPSGTAEGSGTALLSSTIDMSGTADTNNAGTLSTTSATVELAAGDSLALTDAGTLTNQADLAVTVGLHWIS